MSNYMVSVSAEEGGTLVTALFHLIRPLSIVAPGERPLTNGSAHTHPVSGLFRMSVHTGTYPCHASADQNSLDAVMAPHITAGDITAQELIDFQDAVIAGKISGTIDIWANLPAFWKTSAIDVAQMELDGWFADPL